MSIDFLRHNLIEICAVSNSKNGGKIVTDKSGSNIYNRATIVGAVGKYSDSQRLISAFQKTEQAFINELATVQGHATLYKTYLTRKMNTLVVKEEDYHKAREGIIAWQNSTKQFYKTKWFAAIQNLCAPYSNNLSFLTMPTWSFTFLERIINLEKTCRGPLPLELIYRLAKEEDCKEYDWIQLIRWLSKFEDIHPLQKFFLALDNLIGKDNIVKLQINCLNKGCDIFEKNDLKHLAWRKTLKSGQTIDGYTLSNQVGEKVGAPDGQIFFDIANHPKRLFMVANNCCCLEIQKCLSTDIDFAASHGYEGLPSPVFYFIDPNGRYAIVEKFLTSIEERTWITEGKRFAKEDTPYAKLISIYVQQMHSTQRMYSFLDPKYIMLRQLRDGLNLVSVKLSNKKYYNFIKVEKFIYDCSKRILPVFMNIMKWSGLNRTPEALCFKKIIKKTINGKNPNIPDIVAKYEFPGKKVINRAQELIPEIIRLRRILKAERLNYLWENTGSYSFLWPTISEEADSM